MKEFLIGVYIGLGIVGLVGFAFGIIVLINFLAKNNIFFTFVQEGTAKIILKFGKFHRVIMTYEGYGLDREWTVRKKTEAHKSQGEKGNVKLRREPLRFGGLRWVRIQIIPP
jgi:hypothetical protein